MTTTTAAISQPTMGVIHAFFSCLQVSPYVCTSTPVSRPLIEVYSSFPERTSRQTGALLPGWLCARCCWVSPCCAIEVPVSGRTRASATARERPQTANGCMSRVLYSARAHSFCERFRVLTADSQLVLSPLLHFEPGPGSFSQGLVSGLPWYFPCL